MARRPDDSDGAAIRAALQALFLADRAAGVRRDREAYLARFPGFEAEVDAELQALDAHRLRGESGGAGPDESVDDGTDGPRAFSAVLEAGRRLGPHVLLRSLGRGGQGEVWAVRHEGLGREVALKLLLDPGLSGQQVFERFVLEARSLATLRHPAVIRVHDTGTEGGYAYLSMDLLPGGSLKDAIDRRAAQGPPDLAWTRTVTAWCEVLAHGLHHAHQHRLLHRDVKPANVLLDEDGHPVLVDFGLAKRMDDDGAGPTATHVSLGTRDYMSPEQLGGGSVPLDQRSDVYSLGLVLYELLTLERAHADAPSEVRRGLAHRRTPTPVRRLNPHVTRDLERVLQKALAFERADRYDTALDLALDLVRVREDRPVHARPAGPLRRVARWTRRSPLVASGLFAVLSVLIGSLVAVQGARRRELEALRRTDKQVLGQAKDIGELDGISSALRRVPLDQRGFVWGLLCTLVQPSTVQAYVGAAPEHELALTDRGVAIATCPSGTGWFPLGASGQTRPAVTAGDRISSDATLDPTGEYGFRFHQDHLYVDRPEDGATVTDWAVPGGTRQVRLTAAHAGRHLWLTSEYLGAARVDLLGPPPTELDWLLARADGESWELLYPLRAEPEEGLFLLRLAKHDPASEAPAPPLELVQVGPDLRPQVLVRFDLDRRASGRFDPSGEELVLVPWEADGDGNRHMLRATRTGEIRAVHQLPPDLWVSALVVGERRVVLGTRRGHLLDFDAVLDPGLPERQLMGGPISGLQLDEGRLDDPTDDVLWAVTADGHLHRVELDPHAHTVRLARGGVSRLIGLDGDTLWSLEISKDPDDDHVEVRTWSVGEDVVPRAVDRTTLELDHRYHQVHAGHLWMLDATRRNLVEFDGEGRVVQHALPETDPGEDPWTLVPFRARDAGFGLESGPRFLVWGPDARGPEDLVDLDLLGVPTSSLWIDAGRAWGLVDGQVQPLVPGGAEGHERICAALRNTETPRDVLDLSRDGSTLLLSQATGGGPPRLLVLDARTGLPRGPRVDGPAKVSNLQLSADGSLAAALFVDGSAILWDVATGDVELRLDPPGAAAYRLMHLDPDLRWLALADDADRLSIWHAAPPDSPVGEDAVTRWLEPQKDDVSSAPDALKSSAGALDPEPETGSRSEAASRPR